MYLDDVRRITEQIIVLSKERERLLLSLGDIEHSLVETQRELRVLCSSHLRGEDSQELTVREHEVLQLVKIGKRNKEIAETLQITERTVKFHVWKLMNKFFVRNRRELF